MAGRQKGQTWRLTLQLLYLVFYKLGLSPLSVASGGAIRSTGQRTLGFGVGRGRAVGLGCADDNLTSGAARLYSSGLRTDLR